MASWGIWDEIDLLWKGLSAVSAVTAIALPILDWQRKIGEVSNLKAKWSRIGRAYENLWEDLSLDPISTELFEEYRRIRNEMEGEEDNTAPDLPHDKKL